MVVVRDGKNLKGKGSIGGLLGSLRQAHLGEGASAQTAKAIEARADG